MSKHLIAAALLLTSLPITAATGEVIGVSGASEDEDESCAQAGLDAIAESLD